MLKHQVGCTEKNNIFKNLGPSHHFPFLAEQIDYLIGTEKGFVIYCSDDDCGSSEELAYELQDLGFSNILVFKGGWKSWTDAGLKIEKNE